ncbi:MAG: Hpt domain-containing protein [Thermodesulfobacteriota bacterium]|nr:Hpt domain-containing protein [Thermodesulfobacteriota bacterium]
MSDDSLFEEFHAELYDKYYPQIMEGVEAMERGDVESGIESFARPLHTIKGVTGFMAGFEEASKFTHKVESYLKKLQVNEIEHAPENVAAAVRAVNMIFQVIEQIRESGEPDEAETSEVLKLLESQTGVEADAGPSMDFEVKVESRKGVNIIHVGAPRIHLKTQLAPMIKALEEQKEGSWVVLDFTKVVTLSSASWEAVEGFADKLAICAVGLGPACKEIFYSWGFDRSISAFASEEEFWNSMKSH